MARWYGLVRRFRQWQFEIFGYHNLLIVLESKIVCNCRFFQSMCVRYTESGPVICAMRIGRGRIRLAISLALGDHLGQPVE